MNRTDLTETIAARTGHTKAATSAFIDAFLGTIEDQAKVGNDVALVGFGTFKSKARAARLGRNPRTGESVEIPAKRTLQFSTSGTLNRSLNAARP